MKLLSKVLGGRSPPLGSLLSVVDKFSYLGSVVNSSNNLDDQINQRIRKATTYFGRLSSRDCKNHHLAIKLKIRVYTACILSVLLYSSETWCTYRRQENRLNAFHFRCISFQMPSLHSWCLVEGSCPQLHHPASHRFI